MWGWKCSFRCKKKWLTKIVAVNIVKTRLVVVGHNGIFIVLYHEIWRDVRAVEGGSPENC